MRSNTNKMQELTERQAEIMDRLIRGVDKKAIARMLGISYRTLINHLVVVRLKLEASNMNQASAIYASRIMLHHLARMGEDPRTQIKYGGRDKEK